MIVGIDLGTTNSACAIFRDGETIMVPNSLGQVLTPSAVSLDDDGTLLVGLAARERQSTHADQTVTAFKRYMGTDRQIRLRDKSFRAEELSALVLASLKRDAEAFLGQPVNEAVITVPAYFNDKQRRATRRAGELAGIKVERLINEPTAAALAYGLHMRDRETRFMVFDLGGGTFDVSILELFDGVIEVRASAGDNRLGGEDFNEVLVTMMRERFAPEAPVFLQGPPLLYERLRETAERVKRQLGEAESATAQVIWDGRAFSTEITAAAFEAACAGLLQRLREPVIRSLRDSSEQATAMDEVVLVGGATRMPIVRRTVTRMFGRFPSHGVDPDEAVARGAAVQAGLKSRDSALAEVVLTDVCPYSLGIEVCEMAPDGSLGQTGIFKPILVRNCTVPTSREDYFSAIYDRQAVVELPVYQGESRWVRDNILLGRLQVPVPAGRATEAPIKVRFTYDINGLLEVNAEVERTGVQRELLIYDPDAMTQEDVARRRAELAHLKVHPRDSDAAKAVLARAGRCIEAALGADREVLNAATAQFEASLNDQDPRALKHAIDQLVAVLDQFEGSSFL